MSRWVIQFPPVVHAEVCVIVTSGAATCDVLSSSVCRLYLRLQDAFFFFFFTVCRRWRLRRQKTNVYKDLLPLTAVLLPLARREEENIALEKNEKADMKTSQTVEIDLTFKVNCLLFLFTLPRKVSMLPPIPYNILYKKM